MRYKVKFSGLRFNEEFTADLPLPLLIDLGRFVHLFMEISVAGEPEQHISLTDVNTPDSVQSATLRPTDAQLPQWENMISEMRKYKI